MVEIVSSDDSSSELLDLSDKIAATAVFSSDARDFRFFLFTFLGKTSEFLILASLDTSEKDLETVRGIDRTSAPVSDCAEAV